MLRFTSFASETKRQEISCFDKKGRVGEKICDFLAFCIKLKEAKSSIYTKKSVHHANFILNKRSFNQDVSTLKRIFKLNIITTPP